MTADPPAAVLRPARFGLAAKLFAILILLGAVAVLITGVLGYVRAREALERTIFAQLTAARETKARQVETYFRSIRGEMRLLAASKMVVDAMRGFRDAVDELDRKDVPPSAPEGRRLVRRPIHADGAPPAGRRHAGQGLPAHRRGALFPAGPVYRRQPASGGAPQPAQRSRTTAAPTRNCTRSITR